MHLHKEIQHSKALEKQALDECNNEPIQTPETIQSFGALVAFNFDSLAITHASENLHLFLEVNTNNIFTLSIRNVFSQEHFHAISNIASHASTLKQREQVDTFLLKQIKVDVSLFRAGDTVIVEIIPLHTLENTFHIHSNLKTVFQNIKQLSNTNDILKQSLIALKNITAFDRVKAYKFHPDNSGEVVAEINNGKMGSYMGLHFPAFDIPPVARNIFLKTTLRYIHNTSDTGIKINTAEEHFPPLNQTLGILRANSPIHNQYLKNMEVSTSLTLPLIIKGKLWGLLALHHKSQLHLSPEILYIAELIGQLTSMVLEQCIEGNAKHKIHKLHLEGEEFITLNQDSLFLKSFWNDYASKLHALVKCDGVAYQIEDTILCFGDHPTKKAIHTISKAVNATDIYHSNDVSQLNIEGLNNCCGVLAMCVHTTAPKIMIYFFRNELIQHVTWAGNPKKELVFEQEKVRLHPRSSFNEFSKQIKNQSEIWDSETLNLAEMVLSTFKKAVHTEKATSERLKIVISELNHRLRNVLALINSISKQTVKPDDTIDNYVYALERRIMALASANGLLTNSTYATVKLKKLIGQIVLPLFSDANRMTLTGPKVRLSSEITWMMALIIHELTTNAIKHGALSVPQGSIAIAWQHHTDGLLIEWKEHNGPKVHTPDTSGFGTTIIENAMQYEFGGHSLVEYQEDGLYVTLQIPKHLIGENETNNFALEQVQDALESAQPKLKTINILILEDDFIIAQEMKRSLQQDNVNMVSTFSKCTDALESLKQVSYNIAFLDVNLKQETSLKVALECKEQRIAFYYITGYGNAFLEQGVFPKAKVLLKPVKIDELKKLITEYIVTHNENEN